MTYPASFSLQLAADADALPLVRTVLRSWLAGVGVRTVAAEDIVLASWEACANAVEHPVGAVETELTVRARVLTSLVCVSVHDRGRWRERTVARSDRGLGLVLVDALMDRVSIERDEGGTVVRMCRRLPIAPE